VVGWACGPSIACLVVPFFVCIPHGFPADLQGTYTSFLSDVDVVAPPVVPIGTFKGGSGKYFAMMKPVTPPQAAPEGYGAKRGSYSSFLSSGPDPEPLPTAAAVPPLAPAPTEAGHGAKRGSYTSFLDAPPEPLPHAGQVQPPAPASAPEPDGFGAKRGSYVSFLEAEPVAVAGHGAPRRGSTTGTFASMEGPAPTAHVSPAPAPSAPLAVEDERKGTYRSFLGDAAAGDAPVVEGHGAPRRGSTTRSFVSAADRSQQSATDAAAAEFALLFPPFPEAFQSPTDDALALVRMLAASLFAVVEVCGRSRTLPPADARAPVAPSVAHMLNAFAGKFPASLELLWLKDQPQLMQLSTKAYRYAVKAALDARLLGSPASVEDADVPGLASLLEELDLDWHIGVKQDAEWNACMRDEVPHLLNLYGTPDAPMLLQTSLRSEAATLSSLSPAVASGVWSQLVMEMLFVTNDDDERYSIQSNEALLRNIMVQSAEPPFGYPIFLSGPTDV
jgi:hypothetical protein